MAAQIWHNEAVTIWCVREKEKTSETMTVSTRKKIGNGLRGCVCEREKERCSYLPEKPRVR